MKYYHGYRDKDGTAHVTVDGQPLNPRLDLDNHSPDGFEWGYAGSGPAQLALALLANALLDDDRALHLHQPFKFKDICHLPRDRGWTMTDEYIKRVVSLIEAEDEPL